MASPARLHSQPESAGLACVRQILTPQACRIQSLFNSLGDEAKGKTIGLGGDGRYYNKKAAQIIIKLAAANGLKKVLVGQDAIMATPAMSALIRQRKLYGQLLMCFLPAYPPLCLPGSQTNGRRLLHAYLPAKLPDDEVPHPISSSLEPLHTHKLPLAGDLIMNSRPSPPAYQAFAACSHPADLAGALIMSFRPPLSSHPLTWQWAGS